MPNGARFLRSLTPSNSTATSPPATPRIAAAAGGGGGESAADSNTVDSDFVVILAALLCALICVLGLVAVARCAWLRRISGVAAPPPAANKGLKKKVLRSLPKSAYSPEIHAGDGCCAICLSEFAAGDEIRVLPHCRHPFHVSCIDTWLSSHSSCPSCRQILAAVPPTRCHKCGADAPPPPPSQPPPSAAPAVASHSLAADSNFLP